MGKGLIFFCCSCAILLFTIINISIGPIISGKVGEEPENWGTANCKALKDYYDVKKEDPDCNDDCLKYGAGWNLNFCNNGKAMYNMEYTSFIFDIVIGFICGLLGLLHLFDVKKEYVSKTGLIGLGCGFVGFVLTLVYVILNGIVFTNYYDDDIYKMDSDGAFAELKGDKYECFYFDNEKNTHSIIAKYSDLNKKQYNYNKDLLESLAKVSDCLASPVPCINNEYYPDTFGNIFKANDCKYLYVDIDNIYTGSILEKINGFTNKDKADRFLTVLILSIFVFLANIGLAIYGFLLFRKPEDF